MRKMFPIFFSLLLFLPDPAAAAGKAGKSAAQAPEMQEKSEAVMRGEKLYQMLVDQGVLKDYVITWQGVEYDVTKKGYKVCEAYKGICLKAIEVGFAEPVMLAIYEAAPGELMIQAVDYVKYKKDFSQEAAKYFIGQGTPMEDVYKITDDSGAPLFDNYGQLTKIGEAAYEKAVLGQSVDVGIRPENGKPKSTATAPQATTGVIKQVRRQKPNQGKGTLQKEEKPMGKEDNRKSRYTVKQILGMGYAEISDDELNCLHTVPFDDSELFLEKVQDGKQLRIFLHQKDPAYVIAIKYRKDKACNPTGTRMFGK